MNPTPRTSIRPITFLARSVAPSVLAAALAACGGAGSSSDTAVAVALAQNDIVALDWDGTALVAVTANDTALNGSVAVQLVTPPANGAAVVEGSSIRYTPTRGFFGTDSLRYRLTVGDKTAEGDVRLTVTAQLYLSGTVRDNPMPGAQVVATVDGTVLPPVTADASGMYSVQVRTSNPAAFIKLQATGAGPQSHVVLSSLLGDAKDVAGAATTGGLVNASGLPAANVTHVSTAVAVLSTQALGDAAMTGANLTAAEVKFSSNQVIEMATAIKLVADNGVALPAGSSNTLALVSKVDAFSKFVVAQLANGNAFEQTRQAVLGDPALAVTPDTPVAGGAERSLLLVQGEGGAVQRATRLVIHPGGSARVETETTRAAKWISKGGELIITYDQPYVDPAETHSADLDPSLHLQNRIAKRETGFTLRQLAGNPAKSPASLKLESHFEYLDGSRKGQIVAIENGWDSHTVIAQAGAPFVASDVAPGVRWAGLVAADLPLTPANLRGREQDVMTIVDGTSVVLERNADKGTFRLIDGKLEVTTGDTIRVYSRLFVGPMGEERWLVEKLVDAKVFSVHELVAVKVQEAVQFTEQSAVKPWDSYIAAGLWSPSKFAIELAADKTATHTSSAGGGFKQVTSGMWSLTPNGELFVKRCLVDCSTTSFTARNWRLLRSSGSHIYVMETLTSTVGGTLKWHYQRVNVYTAIKP